MAVVSVDEVGHGRRMSSYSNQFDRATDEQMRTHTRVFRVVTDSPLDDQLDVINAPGIPDLWTDHPSDAFTSAVDYEVTETEDPERWYVTVKYELVIDPTTEPAVVRISATTEERVIEEDKNGAGITNSAYDHFDPPPTLPESIIVFNVQKNLASASLNVANIEANYKLHVNSAVYAFKSPDGVVIGSFAIGKVKLVEFTAEPDYRNNTEFWKTTWTFHVRERGWHLRLLDAGFREYVAAQSRYRTITVAGQPVSNAALLNGAGLKLAPGGVPVFRDYTIFADADFNLLSLF